MSPSTLKGNFCKGFGGGPDITFPSRSNLPAWQGQRSIKLSLSYFTRQPRWVQTLDKTVRPLSFLLITIIGILLIKRSLVIPTGISRLAIVMVSDFDSISGGIKYLKREYAKVLRAVTPRRDVKNFRKIRLFIIVNYKVINKMCQENIYNKKT